MKKQFVTYEIALALKELGFNEPCIKHVQGNPLDINSTSVSVNECVPVLAENFNVKADCVSIPLWQQVKDWFREKYKLHIYIIPNDVFEESKHVFRIDSKDRKFVLDKLNNVCSFIGDWMNTYEEAREAAINKAIKIVKGEKNG